MSKDVRTVADVQRYLDLISEVARDAEEAHGLEDVLHAGVLEAVRDGAPEAREMARLALTSADIDFPRWRA